MADAHTEVRLSREMRLVDVMMIGVGAMIGAGIFVLTGIAAGVAGPALILAFLLNGMVSLLTAMAYAELGSCFHDAGGGYLWVKKGLPDPNGFLSGWMSWFAHAVACSLYALGFGAYFAMVVRSLGYEGEHLGPFSLEKVLACGVVGLFGLINYRGASETGKAGNIVTTAKILVLGVFIAFGLVSMWRHPGWTANFTDFLPNGAGGVFMAMGLTFIAFEGYEIIAQCGEEVRDPRRSIPRAIFYSMLIVIPIYLLIAWVAIGAIDGGGLPTWKYLADNKETAMVEAARQFFVGGGLMILVGGLLSTMSALNATIYSSSRVSFAMARDHNLPAMFARLSRKQKTPYVSILFSMGIIVAALLWLPIEDVASAADVMFLLLFLQVNIALIRLRKKMPDLDRGFRVPFVPLVPIVAIAGNLFIAGWLFIYSPKAWITVLVWIAGGAVLHRYYAGPKEEAALEHVAAVGRMERKEYRVLVALSSARTAPALMDVGMAIAHRHGGEVVCLGVLEVAEDEPLIAGVPHASGLDPLVADGVRMARAAGLDAHGLIKIAHRISSGIIETAREENCNFIVMGRRAHPSFLEWLFAATMDDALKDAPCDIALVGQTPRRGEVRRVSVAVGDGRSASLAAELAPALAAWYGATVRAVVVVPPMAGTRGARAALERAGGALEEAGIRETPTVVRHNDIVEGIVQSSEPGDLVILGGPPPGAIGQLLTRPVSLELLDRGPLPSIMVRRYVAQRAGWLERTLGLS